MSIDAYIAAGLEVADSSVEDPFSPQPVPENFLTRSIMAGQAVMTTRPAVIKTLLGSCVSVCLWDRRLKHGAMNHALLPKWGGSDVPSQRYADVGTKSLIRKMRSLGSRDEDIVAKVVGGASIMQFQLVGIDTGSANVQTALDVLREEGISVAAMDTGGHHGRRISFYTDTGAVKIVKIEKKVYKSFV